MTPSFSEKDLQPLQDMLDEYDKKQLCPKCGSEMDEKTVQTFIGEYHIWVCQCGHDEKVGRQHAPLQKYPFEHRHEEKVEGEK